MRHGHRLEAQESSEENEGYGEELRDGYDHNRDHKGKGQWAGQRAPIWGGHLHFIGASKDLATVTITLVPNT